MNTVEVMIRAFVIMALPPLAAYRIGYHLDWDRASTIRVVLVTTLAAALFLVWFLVTNA